ncbi:MAG: DUF192 domain-containing protein [Alphaproteobacteria bacterium]|nr:DUF192 domain-containing protein [Alphaproteobacteria bacterium]
MKNDIKHLLVSASVALAALAAGPLLVAAACAQAPTAAELAAGDPKPQPPGPTSPLTIVSGDKTHTFQVEVADTPEKSELGLMYRKEMAKDHGMIFDFGEPKETTMWMKNTFIPLDMVFFDSEGKVMTVVEGARPHSLRLIDPGMPVKGVIELNAGVAKEDGIKPGDMIHHKIFKNAPSAHGG